MDICNRISSFFQTCFPAKTDVVVYMDKSIHNDCDECESERSLSEKLEEIIQILEEVNGDEEEDEDDENVFYDEAYEDKEKESGKFSLI